MVAASRHGTSTVSHVRPKALEDLQLGDTFTLDGVVWLVARDPVVSTRGIGLVSVLCQSVGDGSYAHAVGPQGYEVQPHNDESECDHE